MLPAIQHPRHLESVMTVPFTQLHVFSLRSIFTQSLILGISSWHLGPYLEIRNGRLAPLLERSQAGPAAPDRTQ